MSNTTSMPISHLKSSLIDRASTVTDESPHIIEGIYGSNGFYFQQRRGRLDLRGLAQIDLDRVVRDVDVDVLQMHLENITFCNLREDDLRFITDQHVVKLFRTSQLIIEYLLFAQEQLTTNLNTLASKYAHKKRSLLRKRKELEELQENSKVLRAQLRSKKKGIQTLEGLLKDASNAKQRPKRVKSPPPPVMPSQPAEQPVPVKPLVCKFFVAGPNGLCVEFNTRNSSTVHELKREVKQAFVSKRDMEDDELGPDPVISLVYRGVVLLNENTLEEVDIRHGDTVVAVIEKNKHVSKAVEPPVQSDQVGNKEMMEFLARQHEKTSAEMRDGWKGLMETVVSALRQPQTSSPRSPSPSNDAIISKVDDRLSQIERAMREQLNSQYEQMKGTFNQMQTTNPRFIVGDLESDTDDRLLSREEIERKLRASYNKLKGLEDKIDSSELSYEDLKRLQRRQAQEIEDLRRMMSERSAPTPTIIYQQQPTPTQPKVQVDAAVETSPKISRKNVTRAARKAPEPEPVKAPPKEPEPVKETPAIVPKVSPAPVIKKPPVPEPEPAPEPATLSIFFSPKYNRVLPSMGLSNGVEVVVSQDISADDLVFELRRKIAEQANLPLARVALHDGSRTISLGVDVDPDTFTAATVHSMVETGELVVELRNPVTDAQIDVLVNQWEHSDSDTPRNSFDGTRSSRMGSLSLGKVPESTRRDSDEIYFRTLQRSRDLGDSLNYEDNDGDSEDENELKGIRSSLDQFLGEVSDKGSLTDDELREKMDRLKGTIGNAPKKIEKKITEYSDSVPREVNLAVDSGSEDYLSDRKSRGVASLRLSSSSFRRSGKHALGIGRFQKRDYDSAADEDDLTLTGSLSQRSSAFPPRGVRYSSGDESQDAMYSDDKEYAGLKYHREGYYKKDDDDAANSHRSSSIGRSSASSRRRYDDNYDDDKAYNESTLGTLESTQETQYDGDIKDSTVGFDATGTGTVSGGTYVSEVSGDGDVDLDRTVDTNVSMPEGSVTYRANEYERAALREEAVPRDRSSNPVTPVRGLATPPGHRVPSTGTASPFDNMLSDEDDGSLELSQSHDTFANITQDPRNDTVQRF